MSLLPHNVQINEDVLYCLFLWTREEENKLPYAGLQALSHPLHLIEHMTCKIKLQSVTNIVTAKQCSDNAHMPMMLCFDWRCISYFLNVKPKPGKS